MPYDMTAFANRSPIVNVWSELTAPPCCCTATVTMSDAIASAKYGSFSTTRLVQLTVRPSGQRSSSNSVNGIVISIGLLIRPNAKRTREPINLSAADGRRVQDAYNQVDDSQKNVLRTSFRSEIHATDST